MTFMGRQGYTPPRLPAVLGELPDLPRALCTQVDPELWFPEKGMSAKAAIKVCQRCPERVKCAAWAIEHAETGVWGGKRHRERERIRAAAAKSAA